MWEWLFSQCLREGHEVIGVSTSEACIKQAQLNFPEAAFQLANMENYVYENSTHALILESVGYSDIRKTFHNVFKNLAIKVCFTLKIYLHNITKVIKSVKIECIGNITGNIKDIQSLRYFRLLMK